MRPGEAPSITRMTTARMPWSQQFTTARMPWSQQFTTSPRQLQAAGHLCDTAPPYRLRYCSVYCVLCTVYCKMKRCTPIWETEPETGHAQEAAAPTSSAQERPSLFTVQKQLSRILTGAQVYGTVQHRSACVIGIVHSAYVRERRTNTLCTVV